MNHTVLHHSHILKNKILKYIRSNYSVYALLFFSFLCFGFGFAMLLNRNSIVSFKSDGLTKVGAKADTCIGANDIRDLTLNINPDSFSTQSLIVGSQDPSLVCINLSVTNASGNKQGIFMPSIKEDGKSFFMVLNDGENRVVSISLSDYPISLNTLEYPILGSVYYSDTNQTFGDLRGTITVNRTSN